MSEARRALISTAQGTSPQSYPLRRRGGLLLGNVASREGRLAVAVVASNETLGPFDFEFRTSGPIGLNLEFLKFNRHTASCVGVECTRDHTVWGVPGRCFFVPGA